MIDGIVAAKGEQAILVTVTAAGYDTHGSFDPATSTVTLAVIRAVFSSPSERILRTLAGRGIDASLVATVPSSVTMQTRREGRADHLLRLPGVTAIAVEDLTVTVDETEYPVEIADSATILTGYSGEVREYEVVDVKRDPHPFAPSLVKNTVSLQELPGRQ